MNQIEKYIEPIANTVGKGPFPFLGRSFLTIKVFRRAGKAYQRYTSHGFKDPIFIGNASSTVLAGASLLTLGSARVLKFTHLSYVSKPLFVASATLGSMSDTLGDCFEWYSPIL